MSSSSEQEQISYFRSSDLPLVKIPSPYMSSSQSTGSPPNSPSTPSTFVQPTSPSTPTAVGASFSAFALPSQVNYRILLATHTTSASWNDVHLMCQLLGVENSWKNMQPSSLSTFVNTTLEVCERSMSSAASLVYSKSEPSKVDNCRKCSVSYDASWHRR